ncbi:DUF3560 domain-containing protein [Aeromonas sp. R7-1]|uniref:DUF3560 domain-containing protein n=1 Tax=Aeromonas sp. R7-1 TaxID=3138473 RepID=UPI0034A19B79
MSATIITMADFEASKTQAAQAARFVRRPVSVLVHWSESGAWESESSIPYAEFEAKAFTVALGYVGGGYQKTSVTVTFDDGDTYQARLDLAASDTHGFTDHCLAMLAFAETEKGRQYYEADGWQSLLEFVKGIDFGPDAAATVAANRAAGEAAEKAEQDRLEAEKQAAIEARRQAQQQRDQMVNEWRAGLDIPADAKGVIVAYLESLDDSSDPYSDYYKTKDDRVIVLAWSKHTRDLFSEMRKAAKNHPDTAFLADPEQSTEHREKYSFGGGYYLTNKGYIYTGWKIQKIRFWSDDKARSIPYGEIAIPGYQAAAAPTVAPVEPIKQAAEQVAEVAAAPAISPAMAAILAEDHPLLDLTKDAAPAPVKPKFTAKQVGGVWSVTIEQGEERHQFDGITAATLAEACRLAWALLTQITPPDDDPSGQPLPVEPLAEQANQPDQGEPGAEAPTLTRAQRLGDYRGRVEGKRERLEVRAVKANSASNHRWRAAHAAVAGIPFGQPILVGHHSERRHRRAIERADQNMRQSVELDKKAKHLASRAASVGHAGIASDDPDALQQLRAKLAEREQIQESFKAANKAKRGTVAAYRLSNNSAEIRRLRQRIEQIEQLHQAAPIEQAGHGWQMGEDDGRIVLAFDQRQPAEVVTVVKAAGFVYARSRTAWVRKVTANAVRAAERLAVRLAELLPA